MKKVFITGGSGLLGRYLLKTAPQNTKIFLTAHASYKNKHFTASSKLSVIKLDLLNSIKIRHTIDKIKPDIIIHLASVGNIDMCEKNKRSCRRLNVSSTQIIADAIRGTQTALVYISSSVVYKDSLAPQTENSPTQPINHYAATKIESENYIANHQHRIVLRPAVLFGWNYMTSRSNFATLVITKLRSGKKIYAATDVSANFLYAGTAASMIWRLIKTQPHVGIWNIGGKDSVSYYNFAIQIAKIFKLDTSYIIPSVLADLKQKAARHGTLHIKSAKILHILHMKTETTTSGLIKMNKEL